MTGGLTCSFLACGENGLNQEYHITRTPVKVLTLGSGVFCLVVIFIHYRVLKIVAILQSTLEIGKIDASPKLVVM